MILAYQTIIIIKKQYQYIFYVNEKPYLCAITRTMRIFTIIKFSFLSVFISAVSLKSCKKTNETTRSVFLWKTQNGLEESDRETLESLSIAHTYIRYADIIWNPVYERSEPVEGASSYDFDIMTENSTAVIFITNEILVNLDFPDMKDFAQKITALYNKKHEAFASRYGRVKAYEILNYQSYSEVNWDTLEVKEDSLKKVWLSQNNNLLIDCDWSESTRDKYFELINELKISLRETEIQSTLRLWQYRDYKLAGIPPVKKCLLMCYSTGDPKNYNARNTIVDLKTIKKYITHSRYPLDLDIALPVYSWGTLFRNKEFVGIISPLSIEYLEENPLLFNQTDSVNFIVQRDTVLGDTYYRYGDELHYQGVNIEELISVAKWIKKKVKPKGNTIISLFSYDPIYFNQLGHENIKRVYRIFN